MSLKVHTLDAHLVKFKKNREVYSEETDEHFHQDILEFERWETLFGADSLK